MHVGKLFRPCLLVLDSRPLGVDVVAPQELVPRSGHPVGSLPFTSITDQDSPIVFGYLAWPIMSIKENLGCCFGTCCQQDLGQNMAARLPAQFHLRNEASRRPWP